MQPSVKYTWKPKSGFSFVDSKTGEDRFARRPSLTIHITTRYGETVTIRRTRVSTRLKVREQAAKAGTSVPERYYSWSEGHIISHPDGDEWVSEKRLTPSEAMDRICRLSHKSVEQIRAEMLKETGANT